LTVIGKLPVLQFLQLYIFLLFWSYLDLMNTKNRFYKSERRSHLERLWLFDSPFDIAGSFERLIVRDRRHPTKTWLYSFIHRSLLWIITFLALLCKVAVITLYLDNKYLKKWDNIYIYTPVLQNPVNSHGSNRFSQRR